MGSARGPDGSGQGLSRAVVSSAWKPIPVVNAGDRKEVGQTRIETADLESAAIGGRATTPGFLHGDDNHAREPFDALRS